MDAFGDDQAAWSLSHPEEAAKLRSERRAAEPGYVAPEVDTIAEAAKAVEGEKPAEPAKPADAPAVAATPVKIDEWTTKSPELKAAFEKDPALRSEIMEMARANEAAAPVLAIVGTKEEAEFAVEHANRLVSVQANWMLAAEDPEMVEPAWNQIVDMFKERDDKGAEIKGADGQPKLGADFQPFVRKAASSALQGFVDSSSSQIAAIKARLAGNYPNDEARAADETALEQAEYKKAAFDFVVEALGQAESRSELPALPPNATPEQIAYQKKLEEREAAQNAKEGKQTAASRKAANQILAREVDTAWSKVINDSIEAHVKAMTDRGEFLPAYVLEDKFINPQTHQVTKVSDLGARMWIALNQKIEASPVLKAKMLQLQLLGPAGKDARIEELKKLTTKELPKLLNARITEIQEGIRGAAAKKPPVPVSTVARVEPLSAATVVPASMNDSQLQAWAEGEAKKSPDYAGATPKEREEMVMEARAKKKYGG